MPEMSYFPRVMNDQSALTDGWHPAYLMQIDDEVTPDGWKMKEKSPRMYRWRFLVWEVPTLIPQQRPEFQNAVSSQAFSPGGGGKSAAKAYQWAAALIGHKPAPGERVDLDSLMPIPCRVKIERSSTRQEYVNVIDLEAYPEGAQYLTEDFRAKLVQLFENPPERPQQPTPQAYSPATRPAPQPGMQTWQQPAQAAQPAVPGQKLNW